MLYRLTMLSSRLPESASLRPLRIPRHHRFDEGPKMIVEMRTYRTKPGMRTRFLEVFRAKSIPEHARLGMPILGPFLSVDDPDAFVFMRGFRDAATRAALAASFYESRLWKDELEAVLMPMLESYDVVAVDDPGGRMRW
ncbi:NIPSNAP family protein [Sphingosinicella sp. LHD-64]|uniref:NIPSNAP family protein n=1 Tax=Sphingosinicella sp. LHD-64 TaxID=3072139 RepID=UPI00280CF0FF|nr:NIPSNAP family protein [Sphingosinicella sp. LHD-64]MDQ8757960.1 NIPSNAP family protein [Sphingosinicella sp. LHD-64]